MTVRARLDAGDNPPTHMDGLRVQLLRDFPWRTSDGVPPEAVLPVSVDGANPPFRGLGFNLKFLQEGNILLPIWTGSVPHQARQRTGYSFARPEESLPPRVARHYCEARGAMQGTLVSFYMATICRVWRCEKHGSQAQ